MNPTAMSSQPRASNRAASPARSSTVVVSTRRSPDRPAPGPPPTPRSRTRRVPAIRRQPTLAALRGARRRAGGWRPAGAGQPADHRQPARSPARHPGRATHRCTALRAPHGTRPRSLRERRAPSQSIPSSGTVDLEHLLAVAHVGGAADHNLAVEPRQPGAALVSPSPRTQRADRRRRCRRSAPGRASVRSADRCSACPRPTAPRPPSARQRVDPQFAGDGGDMQAGGAAKRQQRIAARIDAAADRGDPHAIGHAAC